jgi:hypothetical protein
MAKKDRDAGAIPLGSPSHEIWSRHRDTDDCVLWRWATNKGGYGRVRVAGRFQCAHRMAWEFVHGPIPEGLCVCHRCDVRACINIKHLFLGTATDNMADMTQKGRQCQGERHRSAKLTALQVQEIRARLRAGESQCGLARAYGVTQPLIHYITRGRVWGHLALQEGAGV